MAAMIEDLVDLMLNAEQEGQDVRLKPYVRGLQRYKVWRDNVPLFYTTCVHVELEWPSATVQLYPHVRRDPLVPGLQRHAALYGTQRGDDDTPVIVLASVAVDQPVGGRQQQQQQGGGRWGRGGLPGNLLGVTEAIQTVGLFTHAVGTVDRLRYCPARPSLVAVKSDGAALSLYDIGRALPLLDALYDEEGAEEGGGAAAATARERGGENGGGGVDDGDGDGVGGAYNIGPYDPVSILQSEAQEGVSLAWGASGGGGGELRLFSGLLGGSIGEIAVQPGGTLTELSVRRGGHDGDASVLDLAWAAAVDEREGAPNAAAVAAEAGPSSAGAAASAAAGGLLASAGSDGRTVLWDPRQRQPALQAPRCRREVNSVSFTPAAGGAALLLANGGDDGIVRVYDVRKLGCGGRAAASGSDASGTQPPLELHRLRGHNCVVRQVSYSPLYGSGDNGSGASPLLASADELGRVLLWEPDRAVPLAEEGLSTAPALLFTHAGHLLPVDDVSWSTVLYGTLASVSGCLSPEVVEAARSYPDAAPDLPDQAPALLVWRPAAELLPPPPPAANAATAARSSP